MSATRQLGNLATLLLPPIEVVGLDVSTMALTYLQKRLPMDGGPSATIYKELAQVRGFPFLL